MIKIIQIRQESRTCPLNFLGGLSGDTFEISYLQTKKKADIWYAALFGLVKMIKIIQIRKQESGACPLRFLGGLG